MSPITIATYKPGMETEIHQLIRRVYDEFVAVDYSEAGNRFFYDWIEPSKIAERQRNRRNMLVALAEDKPIGVIEVRENLYVSLLFVDKRYQGQGVAKLLFREAVKECLERNPALEKMLVHASPFSIPIYKRLGFVETGAMQEENGIKYLPMEVKVSKNS